MWEFLSEKIPIKYFHVLFCLHALFSDAFVAGFFLKSWKTGQGLPDNAVLNEWQISNLLEENNITDYIEDSQCSLTGGMFAGASDGWVNGKCIR